jgi:hypothetical protein
MHVVVLLLASRLWLASIDESTNAARSAETILYLVPTGPSGIDSRALADAVALYTRDLQLSVQQTQDDVSVPTAAAIERVTASLRARHARLAFWCVLAEDGRTVMLYTLDARGAAVTDAVNVAGLRGPDVHRAIALNLRGILTPSDGGNGRPSESLAAASAASAGDDHFHRRAPSSVPHSTGAAVASESKDRTSPRDEPAGDRTAAGRAPPHPPTVGAVAEVPATPQAPVAQSALGMAAVVGYCMAWAPGAAGPHQALALQAIGDIGQTHPIEILAGVELALPERRTTAAGAASLVDLPLRLGARLMLRTSQLVTGAGIFSTVHLLSASVTSASGATADTFTAAGGGGIEVLTRGPAPWRFSWEIRIWAEKWIPRTWFLVDGKSAVETNGYAIGLGLGAVFPGR